jgi:hypothetical protein
MSSSATSGQSVSYMERFRSIQTSLKLLFLSSSNNGISSLSISSGTGNRAEYGSPTGLAFAELGCPRVDKGLLACLPAQGRSPVRGWAP